MVKYKLIKILIPIIYILKCCFLVNSQNISTSPPSLVTTSIPSSEPSTDPSKLPSIEPSVIPSFTPTLIPTDLPSFEPTQSPSPLPTNVPSRSPTYAPSLVPTNVPSFAPSYVPSLAPTDLPSIMPTCTPSVPPTYQPTLVPSYQPSATPSHVPSLIPTCVPSTTPTSVPSTVVPTSPPSLLPTYAPSLVPSFLPTVAPTSLMPTKVPSFAPSYVPSLVPTDLPSIMPTCTPSVPPTSLVPSYQPSTTPSHVPSLIPTCVPSTTPTSVPSTVVPTHQPSLLPSQLPSVAPSYEPSASPTCSPSFNPTFTPSFIPSVEPSFTPTNEPSAPSYEPSIQPTQPTFIPTDEPSMDPTVLPTCLPSQVPSSTPTYSNMPSFEPSFQPSSLPTYLPTVAPSTHPSVKPTVAPSIVPSRKPTFKPTVLPSCRPTISPTSTPSVVPTLMPTSIPTFSPSLLPTLEPSLTPTFAPSHIPTFEPSVTPTNLPTVTPTYNPSFVPSFAPVISPTFRPSLLPSFTPTFSPTVEPSYMPSFNPSVSPTFLPSCKPTIIPSCTPTVVPTKQLIINRNSYQINSPWNHFGGIDNLNQFRSKYSGSNTNSTRCNFKLDNTIYSSPVIDSSGIIYVGTTSGVSGNYFYALFPTCTIKWRSVLVGALDSNTAAIGADGTIYIGSSDRFLYAFEHTTGSILWKRQVFGELRSSPIIGSNGTIYIGDTSSTFYALTPSGSFIWNFTTATSTIRASPTISFDNTTIYIISFSATDGSTIYALDIARNYGSVKWITKRPNQIQSTPAVSSFDGTIYIGSFSFFLNALDPRTGSIKWRYQAQNSIRSSTALDVDGNIYFGCNDNNLYSLTPAGSLRWTYRTNGPIQSTPVIDASGIIYFGSNDNSLYAVTTVGTLKWRYSTGGSIQSTTAIGKDGTIYIGSADNNLYAINFPFPTVSPTIIPTSPTMTPTRPPVPPTFIPTLIPTSVPSISPSLGIISTQLPSSHTQISVTPTIRPLTGYQVNASWPHYRGFTNFNDGVSKLIGSKANSIKCTFILGGQIKSTAAVASDGTIYIGTKGSASGDAFYALLPTCIRKWKNSLIGSIDTSSAAIGADGTIYVGSMDKNLYAFEPLFGNILWKRNLNGEVYSSPTIGNDGSIYVTSYDGNLYAISPSGSVKWTVTVGGLTKSTPAITKNNTIIACGTSTCYEVDAKTGVSKALFTQTATITASPVLGKHGVIYVGGQDGSYNAYDAKGGFLWSYVTNSNNMQSIAAVDKNGTIYFGSGDSYIYAINNLGSLVWRFATNHAITSSPTLDKHGVLYIGTGLNVLGTKVPDPNGNFYAIDSRTGIKLWEWDSPQTGEFFMGDGVIGPDGTNYIGTANVDGITAGQFIIFGSGTSAPIINPTCSPSTLAPTYEPTISDSAILIVTISQLIQGVAASDFNSEDAILTWTETIDKVVTLNISEVLVVQVVNNPTSTPLNTRTKTKTNRIVRKESESIISNHLMSLNRLLHIMASQIHTTFNMYDTYRKLIFKKQEASCIVYYTVGLPYSISDPTQPNKVYTQLQVQLNNSVISGVFTNTLNTQADVNNVPALKVVTVTQVPQYSLIPLTFSPSFSPVSPPSAILSSFPSSSPSFSSSSSSSTPTNSHSPSRQPIPTTVPTYSYAPSKIPVPLSPTPAPKAETGSSTGLENNAIVGIAVGGAVVIAILCSLLCCYYVIEKKNVLASDDNDSSFFSNRSTLENQVSNHHFNDGWFSARGSQESPRKPKSQHGLALIKESSETFYEYDIDEHSNSLIIKRNSMHPSRTSNPSFMSNRSLHKSCIVKIKLDGTVHDVNRKKVKISKIAWTDLRMITEDPAQSVIGKGSFGTVYRATYPKLGNADIVVKVLHSSGSGSSFKDDENLFKMAFQECRLMKEAECQMVYQDSIVKVYGIADGALPLNIASSINVQSAIGIVMRFEGGGPLTKRLYPHLNTSPSYNGNNSQPSSRPTSLGRPNSLEVGRNSIPSNPDISFASSTVPMDLVEKIRILTGLARCLLAIHSIGIIHGDIKPDNILLSSDDPPEVRLADFGLARINDENDIGVSSLHHTKATKGTLLYCAPEMIANPFKQSINTTANVAKASRKSDMYAFGLVAWEVLAGCKPFDGVTTEVILASVLHTGKRPLLSQLPPECPQKIVEMIKSCWDIDRSLRANAMKCYSILQFEYSLLTNTKDDVCLSYHSTNHKLCEFYYQLLVQWGLRVTIVRRKDKHPHETEAAYNIRQAGERGERDEPPEKGKYFNETEIEFQNRLRLENDEMLSNSRVVVAFINQNYQLDEDCLADLRFSINSTPPKQIIPVFTEACFATWRNSEVLYSCQLNNEEQKLWDVSSATLGPITSSMNTDNSADDEVVFSTNTDNQIPFFSDDNAYSLIPPEGTEGINTSMHMESIDGNKSPAVEILLESSSHHTNVTAINNSPSIKSKIDSQKNRSYSVVNVARARTIQESKHSIYSEELSESEYDMYNTAYGVYVRELYDYVNEILQKQIAKTREKLTEDITKDQQRITNNMHNFEKTTSFSIQNDEYNSSFRHQPPMRSLANMMSRSVLRQTTTRTEQTNGTGSGSFHGGLNSNSNSNNNSSGEKATSSPMRFSSFLPPITTPMFVPILSISPSKQQHEHKKSTSQHENIEININTDRNFREDDFKNDEESDSHVVLNIFSTNNGTFEK